MYNIVFSKPIQKFTNNVREVTIDGDSYFNLYSNLTNLFPDLKRLTDELKVNDYGDIWFLVEGKVLPMEKIFLQPKKNVDIVIVPVITGGGEDGLMIGIGIALMVVAIATLQPEIAMAGAVLLSGSAGLTATLATYAILLSVGSGLLSMGMGMVLTGVLSAMSPKEQSNYSSDAGSRRDNDAFEGLDNTTSTQTAIPLIYGHHRISGQFISGKIRTINHDRSTFISVANYL
jgi:predicted phage tail protein